MAKDTKKKIDEAPEEDTLPEDAEQIGLREPAAEGDGDMDARWQGVEDVVNAAKEAYTSGQSDFATVVSTMVSTLQDMLASEQGDQGLGGLGVGRPEMALPPEAGMEGEEELPR